MVSKCKHERLRIDTYRRGDGNLDLIKKFCLDCKQFVQKTEIFGYHRERHKPKFEGTEEELKQPGFVKEEIESIPLAHAAEVLARYIRALKFADDEEGYFPDYTLEKLKDRSLEQEDISRALEELRK